MAILSICRGIGPNGEDIIRLPDFVYRNHGSQRGRFLFSFVQGLGSNYFFSNTSYPLRKGSQKGTQNSYKKSDREPVLYVTAQVALCTTDGQTI